MYPEETGIYLTLLTGLTVLMMMVVFFLVSIIRQLKRRDREMKARALRDHTLIEEERKRTAADMHDDLGSTFANVRMKLLHMLDDDPGNELIKKAIEHVERSSEKIRQIAHNLMPGILVVRGLCPAIHELVEEIRSAKKVKVEFINQCTDGSFTPTKSIMVYRVIQEILANAIRHANASRVEMSVVVTSTSLVIDIRDDGDGFDIGKTNTSGRHFGLENIRSRLELLNADYHLVSTPGQGTRHMMEISLQTMKSDDEKRFAN